MNIEGTHFLVTGACGGIGREIALQLASKGAVLALTDCRTDQLQRLYREIGAVGGKAVLIQTDLAEPEAAQALARHAINAINGVDVLINCAGITSFDQFVHENPAVIEKLWRINVLAPMQLTRALLPHLMGHGMGRIVNIGSVFGSIGFACFASCSASKFAMRGFSEALRRELHGSGVGVTYVAPRYTKTPLNDGTIARMAAAVGMKGDEPSVVAQHVVRAIERDRKEVYIGWPECLFVRLNAILPRLVDIALRRQNTQMQEFTKLPAQQGDFYDETHIA